MKYYIIDGEASGDLHGSNLIRELKKTNPAAEFRCWGGDLMQGQGATLVKHFRELAFMGFFEVIANLRTILRNLRFCYEDIASWQPDAVILIDYPGFNLRVASFARKAGIKTVYYISPQVWAWKESRVKRIRRDVDKMLVILPFEKDFYARHDFKVDFVGHPLLDAIGDRQWNGAGWRSRHDIPENKQVIALLPGSRTQEIKVMLPVMLEASDALKGFFFVIAAAPSQDLLLYEQLIAGRKNVRIVQGETYALLGQSSAAWVTSGTATLETALFNVPQVVCYKGNPVSYRLARLLVKVKFISLVNLIMDREVVKELIQSEMNPGNLSSELLKLLEAGGGERMKKDYAELKRKLGGGGASARAAQIISGFLSQQGQ